MESEVTDPSGQREALLPVNHKKLLTISEKRRIAKLRKKGKFWFKLHYGCDQLIELSNNKLSKNNLASELADKRSFWKQSQSRNCNFYD